jgi:AbrB family looped-hinge helix DNA binding protein
MFETVKVNSKYQIVIPKAVRKLMTELKPGVEVSMRPTATNKIELSVVEGDADAWLKKYSGIAKNIWGNDSTEWLKKQRQDWKEHKWE